MTTLLIRLAGPMQSWGTQDRFGVRFTEREPSKSGVIGLACAALGRPRSEPVDDLAALTMGVRVDREGRLELDYHTAGGGAGPDGREGVAKADGGRGDPLPTRRYYLADADFLVGLEGEPTLLARVEAALKAPVWQLSLGRKAFVPSLPLHLPGAGGLREGAGLEEALREEPWAPRTPEEVPPSPLRLVLETPDGSGEVTRADQPYGSAFRDRTFGPRRLTILLQPAADVPLRRIENAPVAHRP